MHLTLFTLEHGVAMEPHNSGRLLDLPVDGHGEARCPATGEHYQLAGDRVRLIESLLP